MKINKSMLEKKVLMKDTNILTFKMQLFRIKMFVETSYHVSRNSLVMEVKKNSSRESLLLNYYPEVKRILHLEKFPGQ